MTAVEGLTKGMLAMSQVCRAREREKSCAAASSNPKCAGRHKRNAKISCGGGGQQPYFSGSLRHPLNFSLPRARRLSPGSHATACIESRNTANYRVSRERRHILIQQARSKEIDVVTWIRIQHAELLMRISQIKHSVPRRSNQKLLLPLSACRSFSTPRKLTTRRC